MTRNAVERRTQEECEIERLVPGGDGFTRLADGRAAFAAGALPGDRIRPRRIDERRDFVRVLEWELVVAGPDRVDPPCPIADACGGCGLMRLSSSAQHAVKADMLREALRRTGRFYDLPDPIPLVTAGSDLGYRQRLRLHVDASGRLGLFARSSHELVEIPSCVVCRPELDQALHELRAIVERDRPALAELASELEIRVAAAGAPIVLVVQPSRTSGGMKPGDSRRAARAKSRERPASAKLSARARALLDVLAGRFAVWLPGSTDERQNQRFLLPGGIELEVPPDAFVQVNWEVNEKLVQAVVTGARERAARRFCDVYCGAGNFTLPLLAAGLSGVGIDRNTSAVEAARRAARKAGLTAHFLAGDAAELVRRLAAARDAFDLVLFDPPRTGVEREALEQVLRLSPAHIAMCSCDAPSLARDSRMLCDRGYALKTVIGFDMFPHTFELEALAWLERPA